VFIGALFAASRVSTLVLLHAAPSITLKQTTDAINLRLARNSISLVSPYLTITI
jgi:hypothetical protein